MHTNSAMFAQANPFRAPTSQVLSSLYRQVGVQTDVESANPHQLVLMLFDSALESIVCARGAVESGDVETKGRAITRASRIVDEGLKSALSPAGGELSSNLANLYNYISMRLMQAHLRNDVKALDECRRLIEPLREAWVGIGAQVQR
jgi:flagellar secretion chaperone FliS